MIYLTLILELSSFIRNALVFCGELYIFDRSTRAENEMISNTSLSFLANIYLRQPVLFAFLRQFKTDLIKKTIYLFR